MILKCLRCEKDFWDNPDIDLPGPQVYCSRCIHELYPEFNKTDKETFTAS